jgi:Zn-dependent protease
LFSLFGFDVHVDASWVLLAVLVAWTLATSVFPTVTPELSPATHWVMGIVASLGLFLSIIFHEMAHSLVARRYGIAIRGITLFIFGGVAELEREPDSARGELFMAAAGPLASLALAAALFLLFRIVDPIEGLDAAAGVIWYLGLMNGMLALFNLVPAFPLDGGRMLRAALWAWRGDLVLATRIAAAAGNVFAAILIVFGVLGILSGNFVGGVWRLLIGLFLHGAAQSSLEETLARRLLGGTEVGQVMTPSPIAVEPGVAIDQFIDGYVYRYHHRSFPVVRHGALVGSMGTEQAAAVDRAAWPQTPVAEVMRPCTPDDVVTPRTDALAALAQMRRAGRARLFVVEGGRLVGILSLRDMLQLLSVRRELTAEA